MDNSKHTDSDWYFSKIATELSDSLANPAAIVLNYRLSSVFLLFVFLFSRFFSKKNSSGHTGNLFIEYILIYLIYLQDFFKICKKKVGIKNIDYLLSVRDSILIFIPLLGIVHIFDLITVFNMPYVVHDLLCGLFLYVIYNWILNHTVYHDNMQCQITRDHFTQMFNEMYSEMTYMGKKT